MSHDQYRTQANPNWNDQMEAEFRSELTELGYIHEVLAEFGPQDTGVFNKSYLDAAMNFDNYAYNELTRAQEIRLERSGDQRPIMYMPINGGYKRNIFRTIGVDWDKYGASSSIIVLDYDEDFQKFRVIKRIEIPKSEYTYDNAVKTIIKVNEVYNPSWVYVDAGAGEYQIEQLHIYGKEHPSTNLHNKVKRIQFAEKIEVPDAANRTTRMEPVKPFMVNQLVMAFERGRIILSPYDEVLHKQLVDYEVERITQSGVPVYTSKNEHFIDALGLAYLAFVQNFPIITQAVKEIEVSSKMLHSSSAFQADLAQRDLANMSLNRIKNPWSGANIDYSELRGDRPSYFKVPNGTPLGFYKNGGGSIGWGSRSGKMITGATRRSW